MMELRKLKKLTARQRFKLSQLDKINAWLYIGTINSNLVRIIYHRKYKRVNESLISKQYDKLSAKLKKVRLSKAQKHFVKTLIRSSQFDELNDYLNTFNTTSYLGRINRMKYEQYNPDYYENRFSEIVRKMKDLRRSHNPLTNKEYVGVEIECLIPDEYIDFEYEKTCDCDEDCECEMEISNYNYDTFIHELKKLNLSLVNVKHDGSISNEKDDGYHGVELNILFKKDNPNTLIKVCRFLNQIGAKVNSSCGLHIHLDARLNDETEVSRRIIRLSHSLPILSQLVPKSRRNNNYCQLKHSRIDSDDRYCAINGTAYRRFKTIEVRLHSSTIDHVKILNWIKLCSDISNLKYLTRNSISTLDLLFEKLYGLDQETMLKSFYEARLAKFKSSTNEEVDTNETNDVTIGA